MTSTKRKNWLTAGIILSTFLMVFLPGMIASGLVQRYIVAACGAVSLICQVLLLLRTEMSRKYRIQSVVVFALTITSIVLMFMLYGK